MPIKCPVCGQLTSQLFATIKGNVYMSDRCGRCAANYGKVGEFARKYERDRQREDYRKDIIQPWEKDEFIKAYPDKAREYYNDEAMRKYG